MRKAKEEDDSGGEEEKKRGRERRLWEAVAQESEKYGRQEVVRQRGGKSRPWPSRVLWPIFSFLFFLALRLCVPMGKGRPKEQVRPVRLCGQRWAASSQFVLGGLWEKAAG
jgi:hypothetical protein